MIDDVIKNKEYMQRRMAEIGQRFLRRAETEIAALNDWVAKLAVGEVQALREIEVVAHRIRGSGAMFGFDGISDAAGGLEAAVAEHSTGDIAQLPKVAEDLAELVAVLTAQLRDTQARNKQ